jgi:chondroitin-sulfate-ABC endolyase/exolyase
MKQKILPLFLLGILLSFSAKLQAQIYSFEDGTVPANWTVSSGTLLNSTTRYKLGTKSLCWTWNAGSKVTVTGPSALSTGSTNKSGGIYFWIYNSVANTSNLVIAFQNSSGVQKCSINFGLNFKGWRCITAAFVADMKHDNSALSSMTITAPSTGNGTIYLDYMEFQTAVKWDRMSDAQCNITQSSAVFDFKGIRSYGDFGTVPTATPIQISWGDTIIKRLDNWYLSINKFPSATEFVNRKNAVKTTITNALKNTTGELNLSVGVDGVVTGPGLYPDYSAATIDGMSVMQFLDVMKGTMLPLAYDYRMNNTALSKTRWLNQIDWFNDQGWADGSSQGGLMGSKLNSAGYFNSLFLMRGALDATRLARELNTLDWLGMWGSVNMPFTVVGENADQIRTMCIAKLDFALLQSDENKRVAALTALTAYFNNAFGVAPGFAETFKPDYSGYHHNGTYYCQYYPDALYSACWVYYLLHDTPYQLSETTYSTLKNCCLTYRLACGLYDSPTATCGRFPNGTQYLDEILPAFAYLIMSKTTPDNDLLAAYSRLWKPTVSPLKDNFAKSGTNISYKQSMGETELCLQATALATSLKVPAESSPKTTLYLPYSGLMINRNATTQVTVKGFSKYIWDYESGLPSDNLYGRYMSYGQVEYTNLLTNKRNNSYSNANWDWSRIPGATTKYLSKAALTYTSSTPYRNFSEDPFLGGVTLNDSTSIFSVKLHDNTFDTSFFAYKSFFYCGNVVLSLGSNISNGDNSNRTETTLFQQLLGTGESISVNGATFSSNLANLTQPVIKDNLGCRFIVKSGSVNVSSANSIYTGVINHGYAPQNQSYAYFTIFNGSDAQETKYKTETTCPVKIIRQDNVAHIVKKNDDKVYAYAIFNQNSVLNDSIVNQVNTPSLVMFKIIDSTTFKLSVSDPDMHRPSGADTDALTATIINALSASFNYEIILNGLYKLDGTNPSVALTNIGTTTKLALSVVDGKCYTIGLKSLSTGLDTIKTDKSIQIVGSGVKNNYIILSKDTQNFDVMICTIEGKIMKIIGGVHAPYALDANDLNKGVYIVSIRNSTSNLNQKIIVR